MEGLKGHKVVDVAVGALHCLAVTEQGKVGKEWFWNSCFLELASSIMSSLRMVCF